jgi:hypothetical protein
VTRIIVLTAGKRQATAACTFAVDQSFIYAMLAFAMLKVGAERIPRTIKESVPSVSEAFLPTASVTGTTICSRVCSDGGSGCESASEGVCNGEGVESRGSCGSRKGSSPPVFEAMVIRKSYGNHAALCTGMSTSMTRTSDDVRRKLTVATHRRAWLRMLAGARQNGINPVWTLHSHPQAEASPQ